jgi:phage protein D
MPTGYTPIYKIMKGGQDITSHFNDRTTEISVTLKGGGGDSDTCKITVDDRDWRIATVEVGVKLEVYLGYKEVGLAQMGVFEVNTVDYVIIPKQIEIVGNSTGFTGAIKAPTIKQFENKKVGDIIKELVAGKGPDPYISPELKDIELPFMNMSASPLHMLHELERRLGASAKFINGKFTFTTRDEGEGEDGLTMPVLVLKPWHITKGFVRHTQRSEYDGVKVGWIDENHVKHYHRQQNENASQEADGADQGNDFLSRQIGRNENEAKLIAKSQMQMLKRAQGEAHLTLAKGNPWIRDQQRLLLSQFRPEVSGSYITDTVTHTYIKDPGISSEILAKPPGDGNDYESLDDGEFYKLGTDGVVGEFGPNLPPMPNLDPIDPSIANGGKPETKPVEVEIKPVNV